MPAATPAPRLVTLFEHFIERGHRIRNEPEDKRRAKRRAKEKVEADTVRFVGAEESLGLVISPFKPWFE